MSTSSDTYSLPVKTIRATSRPRGWRKAITLLGVALSTLTLAACALATPGAAPVSGQAPSIRGQAPVATIVPAPTATVTRATGLAPAPAPTAQAETGTASYGEVSFSYSAELATGTQGRTVPAEGTTGGPWWLPVPEHAEIGLAGYPVAPSVHEPRVVVYPVRDFAAVNAEASDRMAALRQLLQEKPADPEGPLPLLPLVNATQQFHAGLQYLAFPGGHGVRYLTQLGQGPAPVNNAELFYTFQGLTDDGKYYVAAVLPVTHPRLPANADSVPEADRPGMGEAYQSYLSGIESTLAAQGDAAFVPGLPALDALAQSIQVEAQAATLTAGPAVSATGSRVSGQATWAGKPVAGVRVELRAPGWRTNLAQSPAVAETTTDANGQFVFNSPPAGSYQLRAVWPDGEESQGFGEALDIAADQAIDGARVLLERKLTLLEPAFGTKVGPKPTLRWAEFPGITTFKVWIADAGTTELVVDEAVAGNSLTVAKPLNPGRRYDVTINGQGADGAELARVTSEFWVEGVEYTPTPDPRGPAIDSVPPSCQPRMVPGSALYRDPQGAYCFLYPARFSLETGTPGRVVLYGPALDKSADALRAGLEIEVAAAPAADLDAAVDAFAKDLPEVPGQALTRSVTAWGGGPAVLLETVPGRTGSRDVFTFNAAGDKLYRFVFTPSLDSYPQARPDAEELFQMVSASFSFMQ